MSFLRRFERMVASAGRLLDFSGSYNRIHLQRRLEQPGHIRDKQAFLTDRNTLQGDVNRAIMRMGGNLRHVS